MKKLDYQVSKREIEVLTLIANGYTMREIGEKLFVSPHTVISHKRQLLHKFKAKNTAHLVSLAFHYDLIKFPPECSFTRKLEIV